MQPDYVWGVLIPRGASRVGEEQRGAEGTSLEVGEVGEEEI